MKRVSPNCLHRLSNVASTIFSPLSQWLVAFLVHKDRSLFDQVNARASKTHSHDASSDVAPCSQLLPSHSLTTEPSDAHTCEPFSVIPTFLQPPHERCTGSVPNCIPRRASHTRTVRSHDKDTRRLPSVLLAKHTTACECPQSTSGAASPLSGNEMRIPGLGDYGVRGLRLYEISD